MFTVLKKKLIHKSFWQEKKSLLPALPLTVPEITVQSFWFQGEGGDLRRKAEAEMAEVSPGNNAWRLEQGCEDDARVKRVVYLNRPDEALSWDAFKVRVERLCFHPHTLQVGCLNQSKYCVTKGCAFLLKNLAMWVTPLFFFSYIHFCQKSRHSCS